MERHINFHPFGGICNPHLKITDIKNGGKRMASLKKFFDEAGGSLTYDELASMIKENGSKFVDLTEGNYVAKNKYENEIESLNSQIAELNGTLGTRDTDLADLKTKLEAAGADSDKIAALTKDFQELQNKYTEDTKAYEDKLRKQSYEFAVKEFAGQKQFSSNAAKRDFIRTMIGEGLELKDGKIIGADDFVESYLEENSDAFLTDYEDSEYYDNDDDYYGNESYNEDDYIPEYQPQFVAPTPGGEPVHDATQAFSEAFHFTGVRPMPE